MNTPSYYSLIKHSYMNLYKKKIIIYFKIKLIRRIYKFIWVKIISNLNNN